MTSGQTPDTSVAAARRPEPGVRFARHGAAAVITLDRAQKLNALDSGMKAAIASEIPRIARDPQVYGVLWRAAPGRMFCAGGDIREFYDLALQDPRRVREECAREYSLIWLLDCFSKPTVALMDGAVMGTGAGVVAAGTHRVAGASYRFQMPETLIGFFPDNGVCWHLARVPNHIGTWLALTGSSIGRADAFRLGLVTHCIPADKFDDIEKAIGNAEPIDPLLDGLHEDPGTGEIDLFQDVIEECFSAPTTAEIIARLAAEKRHREWCAKTKAELEAHSPLALEVTLQHVRRAKHLDLRQTLITDYRLAVNLVTGNDFLEGVRARIVEKTNAPRWSPAILSDLGDGAVARCFEPMGSAELFLPTRQEMQASRV